MPSRQNTLTRLYSCILFSHFLPFFHFPFTSPPPCGPGWSHCAFVPFVLPSSLIPAFPLPGSQASFLLSHFIFLFSHLSGYHQSSATILGRPTASRHTPICDRTPVLAASFGSLWRYSRRPGSFSSWTVRARIYNSTVTVCTLASPLHLTSPAAWYK